MSWYCDRCGEEYSNRDLLVSLISNLPSSYKVTSKINPVLKEHDLPSYYAICEHCFHYLMNNCNREAIDDYWNEDESNHFGASSRYNQKCKEFDIEYDFYDEEKDCYGNEEPDGCEDDDTDDNNVTFIANANQIAGDFLREKQNKALFLTLINTSNNNYKTVFVTTMQSYLVHIALILNNVATTELNGQRHLPDCLDYICNTILQEQDNSLYKQLIKINSQANDVKHNNKTIEFDIKGYLSVYNKLIDRIIAKTGLDVFKMCHIWKN